MKNQLINRKYNNQLQLNVKIKLNNHLKLTYCKYINLC